MRLRSGIVIQGELLHLRPKDIRKRVERKEKKEEKTVYKRQKNAALRTSTPKKAIKKKSASTSYLCVNNSIVRTKPRGREKNVLRMNNNNNTNDTDDTEGARALSLSPNTTQQALHTPLPEFDEESERETEGEQQQQHNRPNIRRHTHRKMMTELVERPEKLNTISGNLAENWKQFRRDLDIYMVATESTAKDEKVKVAIFLNLVGRDALKLFDTFTLTQQQKDTYDDVIKAFEDFCKPKKNAVFERFMFMSRSQKDGESFDSFLMEIKRLANTCEYGNIENEMIRDRIVHGINDKNLQRKLLEMDALTYDKAVEKCRASEATQEQTMNMNKTTANVNELKQAKSQNDAHKQSNGRNNNNNNSNSNGYKGNRNAQNGNARNYTNNTNQNNNNNKNKDNKQNRSQNFRSQQNTNNSNRSFSGNCKYCNLRHNRGECPAYGKTCKSCSKQNHFAAVCRTRNVNAINSSDFDGNNDDFYVKSLTKIPDRSVHAVDIGKRPIWKENVNVNGKIVAFKVDTGSDVPTLSKRLLDVIEPNARLQPSSNVLRAFGGGIVKPIGVYGLKCTVNNHGRFIQKFIQFEIVDVETVPLLGLVESIKFGWVDIRRIKEYREQKQRNHFL